MASAGSVGAGTTNKFVGQYGRTGQVSDRRVRYGGPGTDTEVGYHTGEGYCECYCCYCCYCCYGSSNYYGYDD